MAQALITLRKGEKLIGRKCGILFSLMSVESLVSMSFCVTEIVNANPTRQAFFFSSLKGSALGNEKFDRVNAEWIIGSTLYPLSQFKIQSSVIHQAVCCSILWHPLVPSVS